MDDDIKNKYAPNRKPVNFTDRCKQSFDDIGAWLGNKADELEEKLNKSAENPSWIENTDTYKEIFEAKCWDEFGTLSKAWVTTLAFLGEYEIDKRTIQEKMESVVRVAENALFELEKDDPKSRGLISQYSTKDNDLLKQDKKLAAYQIGLIVNGLENKVSVNDVVKFARAARIDRIEAELDMA